MIVVKDIEASKKFYETLFGLKVLSDFGKNVIMSEGLVLQEQESWEKVTGKNAVFGGHAAELYFEENELDRFIEKLNTCEERIFYMNELEWQDGGRRVIRIYDPDQHVIEVGESMEYVERMKGQKSFDVKNI